jgi:hypothetical protein
MKILTRIIVWLQSHTALAQTVPFSEVPANDVFWWRGECYIKEDEWRIFLSEPIKRPFGWREPVQVYGYS